MTDTEWRDEQLALANKYLGNISYTATVFRIVLWLCILWQIGLGLIAAWEYLAWTV